MLSSAGRSFTIALSIFTCVAYSSQTTLPTASATALSALIPTCAADCVKEFIITNYPTNACSERDLDCLCRTNTTSGYTLGEGAFRCSLSLCSIQTVFNSDLYDICDSVPGALPRTHATITATVMPTGATRTREATTTTEPTITTRTAPSSSSSGSSSNTNTKLTSSPNANSDSPTSNTEHASVTTATFRSPLTVTSQNLPTNTGNATSSGQSASASSSGSMLEPAAVIGVSVASGISGFFIIGVIIFFCCRKIRRRNQQSKDQIFFEIGGVMSEPPDFAFPPRRPTGPRPMPSATDRDSETSRLITPFEPRAQTPAVVVTGPGKYHSDSPMGIHSADRIGFAISSNSEVKASLSQSSPRTLSDLLPDKPSFGLYPEPLRWSRQKQPRRNSHATLFEEDVTRPRSFLGASYRNLNPADPSSRSQGSRPYQRVPMAGLPANPRAMLHGFGESQGGKLAMRGPNYRNMTVDADTGEKIQSSSQADTYNGLLYRSPLLDTGEYIDGSRQDRDAGHTRVVGQPSSYAGASHSYHDAEAKSNMLYSLDDKFEDIDIDGHTSRVHRESRHSGSLRPLTPVREVRTPIHDPPRWNWEFPSSGHFDPPRMPFSGAVSAGQEIISRPRIVRRDDIKRVQIRRGKPHPEDSNAPYSPDDYWLGHSPGFDTKAQACRQSTDSIRSIGSMKSHMPKRKPLPVGRDLTPSRSGSDLILRVD
ncbi:hypothetical protein BO94DRAFT_154891 [Aspergillus sclerotioniger CBS 115572]|uniref:Extracellular membrane protein CFEM domain-containing protein n=1 Tax=Aspergillus sclerotioniger CBS 115572 TaxID=1450535 RepID=A0A317W2Y7_9EURO|nr:hypothetical protein BO94DRAFT_154891 [Aspergillus sclerotioniger CBS 115572]PWY80279.1 hypothetical protein BO94DRAFT_154891 [Aspergillus sclerotioniger CBS 115572]